MRRSLTKSVHDLVCKPFALLLISIVGGGVGSSIQRSALQSVLAAASPTVLQARRVELVNDAGKLVGVLGVEDNGNIGLAFYDPHGRKRADFGIGRGESPRLDINGPDGDRLLSLSLSRYSKPSMMMSDRDFNGRVYLGVVEPDAPDPNWKFDSWVLQFTGDHAKPLALIGMNTPSAGGVAVFDHAGHRWRTPLK